MAAGVMEWPDNALRHSFASYHLAQFKNAASTALELGHHDSRITFAHYRELVKPTEAERYSDIQTGAERECRSTPCAMKRKAECGRPKGLGRREVND